MLTPVPVVDGEKDLTGTAQRVNPLYVPDERAEDIGPIPVLDRPARVQTKPNKGPVKRVSNVTSDYNVWYGTYTGDRSREREPREGFVDVEKDCGLTAASERAPICMYFAKGVCSKGPKCTYRHNLPTEEDELRLDHLHDVFGRERHALDRKDMAGVGSFSRNNRSLFVSGYDESMGEQRLKQLLAKRFSTFGVLEYVRVIEPKHCSFIRFRLRAAAEFALVAMMDAPLQIGGSVSAGCINVKWAREDQNPLAKRHEQRALVRVAEHAIHMRVQAMDPEQRKVWEQIHGVYEQVYSDPSQGGSGSASAASAMQRKATAATETSEAVRYERSSIGPQLPSAVGADASSSSCAPGPAGGWDAATLQWWSAQRAAGYTDEQISAYYAQCQHAASGAASPATGQGAVDVSKDAIDAALKQQRNGRPASRGSAIGGVPLVNNPHTGRLHPYARGDYGWNRSKGRGRGRGRGRGGKPTGGSGVRKRTPAHVQEDDPNASYGPAAQKKFRG